MEVLPHLPVANELDILGENNSWGCVACYGPSQDIIEVQQIYSSYTYIISP